MVLAVAACSCLPTLWCPRLTAPSSVSPQLVQVKLPAKTEAAKDSRMATSGMPTRRDSTQKIHLTDLHSTNSFVVLGYWVQDTKALNGSSKESQFSKQHPRTNRSAVAVWEPGMLLWDTITAPWEHSPETCRAGERTQSFSYNVPTFGSQHPCHLRSAQGDPMLFWALQAADTCAHPPYDITSGTILVQRTK